MLQTTKDSYSSIQFIKTLFFFLCLTVNFVQILNLQLGPWQELERGRLLPNQFSSLFGGILTSLGSHSFDEKCIDYLLPNLHAEIVAPYPEMISAIDTIRAEGMKTALLTNNWLVEKGKSYLPVERHHFDVVRKCLLVFFVSVRPFNFKGFVFQYLDRRVSH